MPELKLKPVSPGRQNRPAWSRTHTAELGPDARAGEGTASLTTTDVYLDGTRIGSVTGVARPGSTLRDWAAERLAEGVKQHGTTRFNAVDALVRTHLTEVRLHPISHLATAV